MHITLESFLENLTSNVICKQHKNIGIISISTIFFDKKSSNFLVIRFIQLCQWYRRTKMPTVALTLVQTQDGKLAVKYSGKTKVTMIEP